MNLLRRGTNADQLRDSRVDLSKPPPDPKPLKSIVPVHKTVAEWLNSAKVIIASCLTICTVASGAVIMVVRATVRDVVRAELAEVRAQAETAHAAASVVPQIRADLETEIRMQLQVNARNDAQWHEIGSAIMSLREADKLLQQRIDGVLIQKAR